MEDKTDGVYKYLEAMTMESFLLAAKVVLPLLVYMTVGIFIRKMSIFSLENFKALNHMVFCVFMPLTLFFNIYDSDLGGITEPKIFVFAFVFILLCFLVAWIIFTCTIKKQSDAASMIQGVYRSNFVLLGNVIAESLCGDSGLVLVAALAVMVVPMFNILAVILFEIKRSQKVNVKRIIENIFKNPLVVAGFLGGLFKAFHIPFPNLLHQPLAALGDIATPLALVTLGGILSTSSMAKHGKYLVVAVTGKLVAVPLITLIIAIVFGYRGDALVAILAIFASPTAVSSAPMAQSMGGNGELAGEIVAFTSICCLITIFLFVLFLSGQGFI